MTKLQKSIVVLCFVAAFWVLFFPSAQPASSSPHFGFTVTVVTRTPVVTETSVATRTPTPNIPTLPPPPTKPGILIPVTGANHASPGGGLVTAGLIVLAFGLVALGLSMRRR
jgi:hypothetical protein